MSAAAQTAPSRLQHAPCVDPSLNVTAVATVRPAPRAGARPYDLKLAPCSPQSGGDTSDVAIPVFPTDSVEYLKSAIWARAGIPPENQSIRCNGKRLDGRSTLAESGIDAASRVNVDVVNEVPTTVAHSAGESAERPRGSEGDRRRRSPSWFRHEPDLQKLGLRLRARAKAIRTWDGNMQDGHGRGLPLISGTTITVGRVVDGDWYQGYDDDNVVGYFPRNFVQITDVLDETIRPELARDAPASHATPSTSSSPALPPSPFFDPDLIDAYDATFAHTRVSVVFAPTPALAAPFPLQITLTLQAAPGTRIARAVFVARVPDGAVTALAPTALTTDATDAQHTLSSTTGLSGTLGTATVAGAGAALLPVSASGTLSHTGATGAAFTRRSWGAVTGSGVGTRAAEWNFGEDAGPAGRHGVLGAQAVEELQLELSVRPAVCEYEVRVTVVRGEGRAGGLFNTSEHRSGVQRVVLP